MATPKTQPAKVETPVVNLNPETPTPEVNPTPEDGKKEDAPATPATPEETSPALIELQAKEGDLFDEILKLGKTPEGRKKMAELWEVQKSIENEKVAIQKRKKDLEIEAAKNARVAMFDDAIAAYDAKIAADAILSGIAIDARTPADIDAANAANAAFLTSREKVVNELLTKFGGSTSAKKTPEAGTPNTGGGKKSEEIVSIIAPMYAEGKTGAEVRAAIKMYGGNGAWSYFNDGTANAAILAYEKANHLNGK